MREANKRTEERLRLQEEDLEQSSAYPLSWDHGASLAVHVPSLAPSRRSSVPWPNGGRYYIEVVVNIDRLLLILVALGTLMNSAALIIYMLKR
jgi:hypothetical protein